MDRAGAAQYSETYYFDAYTDDGVKLWVNDQLIIDSWKTQSAHVYEPTAACGVRYNIKMEYFQQTGSAQAHLSGIAPISLNRSSRAIGCSDEHASHADGHHQSAVGDRVFEPALQLHRHGSELAAGFTASGLRPG